MPRKYRRTKLFHYKDITTIDGYEITPNKYLICENGDIYNMKIHKNMKFDISRSGHVNKITNKRDPSYYRVGLTLKNGGVKKFSVHRLVASYFCENDDPEHKIFVDHNNGNKLDNNAYNLEWVTPSENAIRSYNNGLSHTKGENCHLAVYSDEQVRSMCELIEKGKTPKEIMSELNLLDLSKHDWKSYEYNKIRGYIKKLRTGTFRKDITKNYNLCVQRLSEGRQPQ